MWEWTAELFQPYPDFIPGPYTEYSTTSFGTSRELRGHSPLLHPGLCRADFRNFFAPPRRDVCAGFRLCQTSP
jgi:iron(II)-dependent oxidoreductase